MPFSQTKPQITNVSSIVTEEEIFQGIFCHSDPNKHCLCYCREIEGLTESLSDEAAKRFIDVIPENPLQLNEESQHMLSNLKHVRLPQVLQSTNIHEYSIPWSPDGVDPNHTEHNLYLSNFCSHVHENLKLFIDEAVKEATSEVPTLHKEVLHHASFCATKCASFHGREAELACVRNHLSSDVRKPLVIYGESGVGKTSVMAMVAHSASTWLGPDLVMVFKFLGTSPSSSAIRETLRSLSLQLCEIFNIKPIDLENCEFHEISQFFQSLLVEILPSKTDSHVLLLLDSIDQLSGANKAHTMNWLPKLLPKTVHVVVSMLPREHGCLDNIRTALPDKECYLEILSLPSLTAVDVLHKWLALIGRTITGAQLGKVIDVFAKCSQPLFLRLLYRQALTWQSYTPVEDIELPGSTAEALAQLFNTLEEEHGAVLVQRALGYFTASQSGLSEGELEDILSLDDEVLDEIYEYWDPPVRHVIRIPQLLWKRIRFDIAEYLVERQAKGRSVIAWYHRQFIETAQKRYLSDEVQKTRLHCNMAVYFEGVFGENPVKPIYLNNRRLHLKECSRKVAKQPLLYSENVYNYRKLTELPFHLANAKEDEKLTDLVLCNYYWILTKLRALNFIQDYTLTKSLCLNEQASLVKEVLALSAHSIKSEPYSLAGQILGRLEHKHPHPRINELIEQARKWTESYSGSIITPTNTCLIGPGGPLLMTLTGHPQLVQSLCVSATHNVVISVSKSVEGGAVFNVWDTKHMESVHNVHAFKMAGSGVPMVALEGDTLVGVCDKAMVTWNTVTGEQLTKIELSLKITCIAHSGQMVVLGLESGTLALHSLDNLTDLQYYDNTTPILLTAICISQDDSLIITGDKDGEIRCLTQSSGAGLWKGRHEKRITCLLSCREHLVSGSEDSTLAIWLPNTGKRVHLLKGHTKAVTSLQQVSSRGVVISGSLDGSVRIWLVESGMCQHILGGHTNAVWCLTTCGSDLLVSGSKDDYLKVWNIQSGECVQTLEGHLSWISCVAALDDQGLIVSGSNDKSVKLWKLGRHNESWKKDHHCYHPEGIATIPGKDRAVSGALDSIKVWDISSGRCLKTLSKAAICLCVHPKFPDLLVSGDAEGIVTVWRIGDESTVMTYSKEHTKAVTVLACNAATSTLYSASSDGSIREWTLNDAELACIRTYSGHSASIKCLAISKDCTLLASGSHDTTVCLWNVTAQEPGGSRTGKPEPVVLAVGRKVVWCLALNDSTTVLASGNDDTSLCLWDLRTHRCLHTIGYTDSIKCAMFLDDRTIVAGAHCGRNQLKSWDVESGGCVGSYDGHTHAVMCMTTIGGGARIVTGSRDGKVKLWDCWSTECLASFDLQSQIKHICVSERGDHCVLVATTKSGPIALLHFNL